MVTRTHIMVARSHGPHQGLQLEGGWGPIKYEDRFDAVVKQLADPAKQDCQVGSF